MATFETIKLDKGLYRTGKGFNAELEKIDPSENYKGTSLENLDAFERQLKRFNIKIKGKDSSPIEKFFQTSDSAVLFPEYVSRAVRQGLEESNVLSQIVGARTETDSLDYRTINALPLDIPVNEDYEWDQISIEEGSPIPEAVIKTKDNLVRLKKKGKMLVASYEALKFQRLDIFSIALKKIGADIAAAQVKDAIVTLFEGDGNDNAAEVIKAASSGTLTYADLVSLWNSLYPYNMNTVICSGGNIGKILNMSEMRDSAAGLNFHATGKMITPLGANIVRNKDMNDNFIIGIDKNYALEMVTAGGIVTDFDKLIDRQLHRAAITETYGFAKLFDDATKAISME